MLHLLRLFVFAAFVLLALLSRSGARRARRRRVTAFVAFTVAVSLLVGVSRRESWPFATWSLVSGRAPLTITNYDFELLSAGGRVTRLDPRVWQPVSDNEILDGWVAWHWRDVDAAGRDEFARYVLARAERARQRVVSGGSIDANGWLLRRLAAPYAFSRWPLWLSAADVPSSPFTGVQLVKEEWDVMDRFRDPARVRREIVHQLRE